MSKQIQLHNLERRHELSIGSSTVTTLYSVGWHPALTCPTHTQLTTSSSKFVLAIYGDFSQNWKRITSLTLKTNCTTVLNLIENNTRYLPSNMIKTETFYDHIYELSFSVITTLLVKGLEQMNNCK